MFSPVGPHAPAVYWRRRALLLAVVIVLLVVTMQVAGALTGGGASPAGAATSQSVPASPATTPPARTAAPTRSASPTHVDVSPVQVEPSSAPSKAPSSAAPPPACERGKLHVSAVVEQSSYAVGEQPVVMLETINTTRTPCVESFGDGNVELRVYNGEARVWGSNDCGSTSASQQQLMQPGVPVRVRMTWTGLTSQPGCKGARLRVNAGTYTLYASLDGRPGSATQFSLH